jgi:hypothetical protein
MTQHLQSVAAHKQGRSSSSSVPKKKRKRTKRQTQEGEESDDSSSTGSSFEEENKIQRIARKYPGKLTLSGLREISLQLANQTGEDPNSSLLPLFGKYYHLSLRHKLTAVAANREAQTICRALDCICKGDILSAMDILVQRLKATEIASQHNSWAAAHFMELVPPDRPLTTSRAEQEAAALELKKEERLRRLLVPQRQDTRAPFLSQTLRPPWKGGKKGDGKSLAKGKNLQHTQNTWTRPSALVNSKKDDAPPRDPSPRRVRFVSPSRKKT